ncbi:hypothetical protein J3R83DRAFT_5329 [Lanmaoa asiatica]|nr:hypothetical protein J3R83DRAFT_5329 [Lanmaoa asiatica]
MPCTTGSTTAGKKGESPRLPPKGASRKKPPADSSATHTPVRHHTHTHPFPADLFQTLAEQLSLLHLPRPFKNTAYARNTNRRTKNLKTVLGQERERERTDRERRRLERDVAEEEDVPTCTLSPARSIHSPSPSPADTSIEAPPSLLPPRHYCDITGLEAPYTDPRTGLRYHDKSVYDLIKNLSPGVAKDYLSARGVNPIVK